MGGNVRDEEGNVNRNFMSVLENEYYNRWYREVCDQLRLHERNDQLIIETAWERGYRTVGEAVKWLRQLIE